METIVQPKPDNLTTPVAQKDRIILLDSLRGFAILGILLMNIPSFGLPAISGDPSVLGETGINYYSWFLVDWAFDGTQRALFSMLFGAGIILFIRNKEKNLVGMLPADYFFRRQLWLMLFSLIDVFILLWYGDILLDYACLGMLLFVFRGWSPKALLMAAGVCFLFMLARENRELYLDKRIIAKGESIATLDTSANKLTLLQKEQLSSYEDFRNRNTPEAKKLRMEKTLLKNKGDHETIYEYRTNRYISDLSTYLFLYVWDVLLFMFIGMAFFKMGILTGQAPVGLYVVFLIIGLGLGLTLSYFRLQPEIQSQFNRFEYVKSVNFEYYELSRTLRALGFFGLIMLLYKSGWFRWLFALVRPAGQMAFTNYLMQSLLCGFFFYGIGLNMYGQLERYQIYLVVAAVWIIQIMYSHIWLRYFLFGPFEWLWRTLTYWKTQPFVKIPR